MKLLKRMWNKLRTDFDRSAEGKEFNRKEQKWTMPILWFLLGLGYGTGIGGVITDHLGLMTTALIVAFIALKGIVILIGRWWRAKNRWNKAQRGKV